MKTSVKSIIFLGFVVLSAGIGPLLFPAAMAGHGSLSNMATRFLLPSAVTLVVAAVVAYSLRLPPARLVVLGAVAGVLATLPLEAVRLTGFHFNFMPGNLPRLMGVLLLDRFALGPSLASDIAGWTYHFWNGACFAILYVMIFGTARRWLAVLYGIVIGIGFMVSPVVTSLGIGKFGLEYSMGFPITVTLAHLAYGATLGILAARLAGKQPSPLLRGIGDLFGASKQPSRSSKEGSHSIHGRELK
jgi:hypothetical protein